MSQCDHTKVSRTETGQPGTRAAELRDLLAAYGAEAAAIDALEALARWRP